MTTILGIVALIGAALFGVFWRSNKPDAALTENNKVKATLAEKDKELAANNTSLKQEEVTRQQLKSDMENAKNEENPDNVLDFFNNKK